MDYQEEIITIEEMCEILCIGKNTASNTLKRSNINIEIARLFILIKIQKQL